MKSIVQHKLNLFRRKANLYNAFSGLFVFVSLITSLAVIYALLNATFINFISVRKVLFVFFVFTFLLLISVYVIRYLYLAYRKFYFNDYIETAKRISDISIKESENLVQNLELEKLSEGNNNVLIDKALEGIAMIVSLINLDRTISIRQNLKKYKYIVVVSIAIVLINFLLFSNALVLGFNNFNPFKTSINLYNFNLTILTDSLEVAKGKDFELLFALEGKLIPSDVHILMGNSVFYADKVGENTYKFKFVRINETLVFRVGAAGFSSSVLSIKAIPVPILIENSIYVVPPLYTKIKPFIYVPGNEIVQHAKLIFSLKTYDTDSVFFNGDSLHFSKPDLFTKEFIADSSFTYCIELFNFESGIRDKMLGKLDVIPDFYPEISVNHAIDSANLSTYYFSGAISDDYGFKSLVFEIADAENNFDIVETIELPINLNITTQNFYFTYEYIETSNRKLAWRFKVKDNDAMAGFKASMFGFHNFIVKNSEELQKISQELQNQINSGFKRADNLSKDFKKELEQFKKDLVNLKVNDYEKKQHIQELQEQYKKLDKELNELKKNLDKLDSRSNLTDEQKEALKEKQQMLQELMDSLVTDEIKKLLDEIKLLEQKLNPEQYNDLNRKLEDAFEQLDNQMNRTLELYRKYKVEESLQNALNTLDKMQNEENLIDSLTSDKKTDLDLLKELLEKQQRTEDALENYLKEAEKVNSERSKSDKLSDYEQEINEMENNLEERKNSLQNRKTVKEKTQKNKNTLKQLKDKVEKDLQGIQKEEPTEDMEAIRHLLDNLLSFSFLQEKLMTSSSTLSANQPELVKVFEKQKALKGYFDMVEDSLVQLGKRNFAINSKINTELYAMNVLFGDIEKLLSENFLVPIATQQQSLIFHSNNLAVMLK